MIQIYTNVYANISINDQVEFEDGYQQILGVGWPLTTNVSQAPGYLVQYKNSNPNRVLVIDRLKVSVDFEDNSKNILAFNRFNAEQIAYSMQIPIPDLVVGNPNYTNFTFFVPPTWSAQVAYIPTSVEETINQWFQFRVRYMPWHRTKS